MIRQAQVGVLRRDGTIKYETWLGFIDRRDAKARFNAKPVLLKVKRVDGQDLPEDHYVQGCWVGDGVYALVDSEVAVVHRLNRIKSADSE